MPRKDTRSRSSLRDTCCFHRLPTFFESHVVVSPAQVVQVVLVGQPRGLSLFPNVLGELVVLGGRLGYHLLQFTLRRYPALFRLGRRLYVFIDLKAPLILR